MSVVDFIQLHNHTENSLLDGMPRVEDYVVKSNEIGYKGLAVTEHGNLRSTLQLAKASTGKFEVKNTQLYVEGKKYDLAPIKPIYGIEFYIVPYDYRQKGLSSKIKNRIKSISKDEKHYKQLIKEAETKYQVRTRFHILAFAKNNKGLENLFYLNYLSWKNGFYYRPRIDMRLLKKYHEGVIITSACIGGIVPNLIVAGKMDEAAEWIQDIKKVYGDDFYLEIQPHNIKEQKITNKGIIELADELDVKIIATNDSHYLNKDDWESHEVLLAIQSKKKMTAADRWRFDDREFYFKSKQEMIDTFMKYHGGLGKRNVRIALENTMEIYEKCDVTIEIDKKKGILPTTKAILETKKDVSAKDFIVKLCIDGWKYRNIEKRAGQYAKEQHISYKEAFMVYKDRLKMELERIFNMRFENYFLIIWDLINWAKNTGIMVGPGRGSSSGSLVAFLLGITAVDPVQTDLLFDRFLSPQRIDYPDIDMDFQDNRRNEIYDYLAEKYGDQYVCRIGTTGRMKGKAALLSVGKVFGIPVTETFTVNKHIIERHSGDARANQTVEDSFNEFEVCKNYNKKYPQVLRHVKILEGKAKFCVTGDTIISGEKSKKHTIYNYYKFKKWLPKRLVKVWNGFEFVYRKVDAVYYNGIKDVYLLTIGGGKYKLKATADELILTENKWKQLIDLEIGEYVAVNGRMLDGRNKKGQFTKGFIPWNKGKNGSQVAWNKGMTKNDHPAIMKQAKQMIGNKNGRNPATEYNKHSFKKRVLEKYNYTCVICGVKNKKIKFDKINRSLVEAHHLTGTKQEVKTNYHYVHRTDNGIAVCRSCHLILHGWFSVVDYQPVDSIEYIGKEKVYDLTVKTDDEAERNFIANGVVVHNCGVHPAGIQIADRKIWKLVPIEYRDTNGQRVKVSGYDWRDCQEIGLVKLDVLGLKTLTVLSTALELVEKRHGVKIDLETVDLEDKKVLNGFTNTEFVGIFQFDSIGMTNTCEPMIFDYFSDVVALTALYRPSSMRTGTYNDFINRKIGKEKVEKIHPIYDKITEKTYGIVVYQEQLLKLFVELANFRPGKADEIRKVVAKSVGNEAINKEKEQFLAGAVANGMDKVKAEKLFENMAFFGSYAFGQAHATAYSMVSFWTMYMKIYYPMEFYSALLKHETDQGEMVRFIADAKKHGIDVFWADVNSSDVRFTVDNDGIRIGLIDIKGVGEKAAKNIIQNQPYNSIHDFCNKVERRIVHKGVINALVRSNAFSSLYPDIGALLYEVKDDVFVWQLMLDKSEKEGNELYKKYVGKNIYDNEKLIFSMAKYCPVQSDKHLMTYYHTMDKYFDKNFPIYGIGDIDESFANNSARIRAKGIQFDIKYNNVGDFHKEEPDEKTKKRIAWGSRYANINVEDETGLMRMLVDHDIFPTFRNVIDMGEKTPIMISGRSYNGKTVNIDILVEVESMKKILDDETLTLKEKYLKLNVFQRYFIKHPVKRYRKNKKFVPLSSLKVGNNKVCVLIMRVKKYWTKHDKLMYFISLEDDTGGVEGIVWPEQVIKYRDKLETGNIITALLKHKKDGNFVEAVFSLEKKYFNFVK